jgi:predicted permease
MNLRDLKLRARALFRRQRVEQELDDELAFHVERETKRLIDQGLGPAEAHRRARTRFGSPALAADECRDARGTAFVDNTIRDIQYALRTFRRAPLAACTIVVTVAIGLGVVAVLFTILNRFLFRVDQVPDISAIYAVERPRLGNADPSPPLTRSRFEALRTETNVFADVYAARYGIDFRVDGRTMSVTLVTGNFFQVVGVNAVMGRTLGPADDARSGGHPVLVLSDKGWDRRFRRDPNVLGRTVLVNGAPFEIVGVMPAGFRGLQVSAPDFWAPLSQLAQFRPGDRGREDVPGVDIVGRLKPGMSRENARAQLAAWDSNQPAAAAGRRTMTIDLVPRRGTLPDPMDALAVFIPVLFAFGPILMIGCANVANLLLARGVARQCEIGVRLSLGASRRRIVRQLMTENLLLAMAAAAGGYLFSRLALEGTVYWVLRVAPVDLGDVNISVPAADWRVALFLVVAATASTALFALMPALQATRIEPVRTMRGELVRDARPGRARNALIAVQVFASALLLVCAAIFLRSGIAASRFDPGLRTADTVMINFINEPKRAAVLRAIAGEPAVSSHAALWPALMIAARDAFADTGAGKTPVGYKYVSAGFFDVLGIPIVRGRSFTAAERDGHPVVIVSESLARTLWPNHDGVGETFRLEEDLTTPRPENDAPLPPRIVTVVGVARDVPGFRFTDVRKTDVFVPAGLDAVNTSLVARVTGDPDVARQRLLDQLNRIDPNMGMVVTLRSLARLERLLLGIAFWVSLMLGGLALLLTVSGLFSVLSYLVEQRTREIGVRMALGASSRQVTQLILSQATRPVMYGLAAGTGLAAALATALMATPNGALIARIVHITDPLAYAASLIVILAASLAAAWLPAMRATSVDPMQALRQE